MAHLARAGSRDATVPPFWARRAARLLDAAAAASGDRPEARPASHYSELPNKEHWWWDSERANDGGALNDEEMRSAFRRAAGPAGARPPLPPLPSDFTLLAHNPASYAGRAGWQLVQSRSAGRASRLRIAAPPAAAAPLTLTSRNLRRFVAPWRQLLARAEAGVVLDGQAIPPDRLAAAAAVANASGAEAVPLCRLAAPPSAWAVGEECGLGSWQPAERGPSSGGHIKQAMQSPFAIVSGGGGAAAAGSGGGRSAVAAAAARDKVAADLLSLGVYLANLFVLTSDASPAVLTDEAPLRPGGNLLLLGGPAHNAQTARLAAYWAEVGHAVSWSAPSPGGVEAVSIGGCELPTAGVGLAVLGPRPGGGLALVLSGDARGIRSVLSAGEPTIPPMARAPFSSMLPDFLAVGPEFGARGFGGALAAGFLGFDWSAGEGGSSWFGVDCAPPGGG